MNGIHDMGGMHGFGPVEREANEPVFHAAWEARLFAIRHAMGAWGKWNIDGSRYAREIIPPAIIEKPPSAELAPGQKDTDSLPPYEVLDEVLKVLIEGERLDANERIRAEAKMRELNAGDEGRALVMRVKRMIARNEYKRRQAPPILRVRARAFGSGRQMPIAAHYL